MTKEDWQLARACEEANQDPEGLALEQEWDKVQDEIEEPWEAQR